MDVPGAVAIGEQEAAVIEEGEVRGHEGVAAPAFHSNLVLVLFVNATVHRRVFFPNRFARKRKLGEGLYLLIRAHIKKLLLALRAHLDAMSATLELFAKGTDEFAVRIKTKNGRMLLQIRPPLVDDVQQPLGIHGHVMSRLPSVLVRQLCPAMLHFVLVLALANDELLGVLFGQQQLRRGNHCGGRGGRGKKTTTGNRIFHKHKIGPHPVYASA